MESGQVECTGVIKPALTSGTEIAGRTPLHVRGRAVDPAAAQLPVHWYPFWYPFWYPLLPARTGIDDGGVRRIVASA
jgi:hypothetical protein